MLKFEPAVRLEAYEKLLIRSNSPRVVIDNGASDNATLVKVDSARRHGLLLDAVQILTDLNLIIKRAYVSNDGIWFMDVFHVTDLEGNKVTDDSVIAYLEQSLSVTIHRDKSSDLINGLTLLELNGTDRIGLLSELSAVLSQQKCDVVEAKLWTHNGRIASLIRVNDCNSGSPIDDSDRIDTILSGLRSVLSVNSDIRRAKTSLSMAIAHTERRLHQMMLADQDSQEPPLMELKGDPPMVTVENWTKRGYSVVYVQCRDRTRLTFDVVCTLTDMGYVVCHANINTTEDKAHFEFCIRHVDGTPIHSEPEQQSVIRSLRAAIQRRTSKGVRLELCTEDRPGLLADVTRTFREHGLNVETAEISTPRRTALNVFYVTDALGNPAHPNTIESIRQTIGASNLNVKELPPNNGQMPDREERAKSVGGIGGGTLLLSLGSLVRRNLYNLGWIKSIS